MCTSKAKQGIHPVLPMAGRLILRKVGLCLLPALYAEQHGMVRFGQLGTATPVVLSPDLLCTLSQRAGALV